jgi:hypothetical protein
MMTADLPRHSIAESYTTAGDRNNILYLSAAGKKY